jgi:hypothetical protein
VTIGLLAAFFVIVAGRRGGLRAYLTSLVNYFTGNITIGLIIFLLLGVAIVALWLAVRVSGKFVIDYLTTNNYTQYQILDLISYLLIANLSFSLIKNLKESAVPERAIRYIATATAQAVLIGIIIFIPKSSSVQDLNTLADRPMGVLGFFLVVLSLALILFVLVFALKHFPDKEIQHTSDKQEKNSLSH